MNSSISKNLLKKINFILQKSLHIDLKNKHVHHSVNLACLMQYFLHTMC